MARNGLDVINILRAGWTLLQEVWTVLCRTMDVCRADAKGEQRPQQYNSPLSPPITLVWEKLRGNLLQKAHFGLKPNAGMGIWEGEEGGGG